MSIESKKNNWYKLFYQFVILGLLGYMGIRLFFDKIYTPDFEAYCPLGGLQALGSFMTRDSLSCAMTSMQITMGIMLFAGVILFSKLFCGYICPLGTISEWIGKLGDKLKVRLPINRLVDLALRLLKYALLFITFYFTLKSSELFCKKFDPYYAVASGFNTDVVVLWALIAISIYLIGSLFLRLFWCKYLCPLSALSNIFKFTWWFAGAAAIYIIILLFGIKIPYVYLLIVISVGGYLLEILKTDKVKPSLVHISRNKSTCIDCNLCSNKCPQGIDVAKMDKVNHVDCTLCGDCLYACPEKDTLQINRRNMNWLPAAALTVLIVLGLIAGSLYELPTIDLKWGTADQIANAGIFTKPDLKNIKCFGSSTTFANQMKKVNGIYGVSTYVGTHTVKILYDKSQYDDVKIQKLLFVPEKRILVTLSSSSDSIAVYSLTVDNFFDPLDATYLQYLLKQNTDACGYQSEFACPVIIRIYFPAGKQPDMKSLKDIIESRSLTFTQNGNEFNIKLNYRVITISDKPEFISWIDYSRAMYTSFSMRFNKYSTYSGDVISRYELAMGNNIELRSKYNYIGSHLSNYKGIIGFDTSLDSTGIEIGSIFFVDSLTNADKVYKAINADSLLLHFSDGRTSKVVNTFEFPEKGILKK
jgi:polyferredoxin